MLLAYRIAVLERLNERLGGRLVVCAGDPPGGSSLRSIVAKHRTDFRVQPVRNVWLGGETVHAQFFWDAFRAHGRPGVVMAEESPRTVTQPLLLQYARRKGIGRVLWGHFSSNNRPFSDAHMLDRYRIWLARSADACVCYTEPMADLLRPHVCDTRLFVARNTMDMDTLLAHYETLSEEGKPAVRRRLGLDETAATLVFIGRLVPEKGVDVLLDVFSKLRARQPAQLLVVGEGPARAAMAQRIAATRLEGVHLLGAMPSWAASAPYLYASDMMLMPGALGLSVNHAFAFGLPIVSQAAPPGGMRYHGPEVAFVKHGVNGMLAPFGDVQALLNAVQHVLEHLAPFSEHALRSAREDLRLETMVDGLEQAIRYAEAQSTRAHSA